MLPSSRPTADPDRRHARDGLCRTVSDRVVFMDKGVVLEDAAPAELFGNPKHQRTREFLSRYLNDK